MAVIAMLVSSASAAGDATDSTSGPAMGSDPVAGAIAKCEQVGAAERGACVQRARESGGLDTLNVPTQRGAAPSDQNERPIRRRSVPPPSGGGFGGPSNPY